MSLAIGISWPALPLRAQTAASQTDPAPGIQQRWGQDLGPAARNLKAATQDGVARISGSVDNLLIRDQALRIASRTPGVLQILDQVEVQPELRPDAAIQEDAQRALRADPVLRGVTPQVTVTRGAVTLSGATRSLGEKQLAQEVVKGIRGVAEIRNELAPQVAAPSTDFELETDIRELLKADRGLAPDHLEVQVLNGQATLSGRVRTLAEKQRAAQIAWSTGVNAIDNSQVQVLPNNIQVGQVFTVPDAAGGHGPEYMEQRGSGRSEPTDQDLEREIRRNLRRDPQLCGDDISVKVRNGQAFVSGRVKNIDHQAAVFSDAYIAGAWRVDMTGLALDHQPPEGFPREMLAYHSELLSPAAYTSPSIGAPPSWSDESIKEAVRAAILYAPRLAPYMIMVSVDHGKVLLTGAVDNLESKRLAGEEAADIRGVEEVVNRLAVHPNGKPADQEVADNARAAIQRDPVLARGQLQVAVEQGQAVLSGTADSDFAKAHAEDLVSRLNGVVSVEDEIKVNTGS